jgi:KUP system potassium uptake protein
LPFICIDLGFFLANSVKIADGGWFPLAFGLIVFVLLTTWKRGRERLSETISADGMQLVPFITQMVDGGVERVPGTAVFMTQDTEVVPHAMLHSLKHYKRLHERVIVLSVKVLDEPYVPEAQRVAVKHLSGNFSQVIVHYGYKNETDIPAALALCASAKLDINMMDTTFFLGRETLIPKMTSSMNYWRTLLFIAMFKNSGSATAFFKIPSNRVVELGSQVVL